MASGLSKIASNGAAYCWAMRSRSVRISGLSGVPCVAPSQVIHVAAEGQPRHRRQADGCLGDRLRQPLHAAMRRSRSEPSSGGIGAGGMSA